MSVDKKKFRCCGLEYTDFYHRLIQKKNFQLQLYKKTCAILYAHLYKQNQITVIFQYRNDVNNFTTMASICRSIKWTSTRTADFIKICHHVLL